MSYTFKELKHMKVTELREIAAGLENEEVKGYTQLNKDHLLEAICKALHIEMHEHHEVVGVDKSAIKTKIRTLKKDRDKALNAKDKKKLIEVRKKIKQLKNDLRRATV
ncbi:Rho termination factor N-terminal domain-containing protein [bacterium]|nr:Rho termination factor N-terminal domain-containing protein [bacterium]